MPYLFCLFIEYFLNGADGTKEVRGFVRDINRFVVFTGYHLVECFDVFYGEEIGGRVGFVLLIASVIRRIASASP